MKSLPVYKIRDFRTLSAENAFYANYLKPHIKEHDFTNKPHKHDFYFLVLFTSGSGVHEIDFKKYIIRPGSLFVLRPGQMHNWQVSADGDGYIFFHTRDFYEERFNADSLSDYSFYSSHHASPYILLKNKAYEDMRSFLKEITEEYYQEKKLRSQKLHALVKLIYIEVARQHHSSEYEGKENYMDKLKKFEELIDQHFKEFKTAGQFASKMNITEKHLNRISQTCLHKTSTDLISERIVLEAKRMLLHSQLNINEIAYELGFSDKSYFTRFLKNAQKKPQVLSKKDINNPLHTYTN